MERYREVVYQPSSFFLGKKRLSKYRFAGMSMNAFELTRALIDIDSVTPNEERVGDFLFAHLGELTRRTNGHV